MLYNLLSRKPHAFRQGMNCESVLKIEAIIIQYTRAVWNLSLISQVKMVRDGIRPPDRLKEALSMKQELPMLQQGEDVNVSPE